MLRPDFERQDSFFIAVIMVTVQWDRARRADVNVRALMSFGGIFVVLANR
jgi:hypothetical protein